MATPIGRPVSPTYTPATPPAARVAPPASTPPALETSKPVQTQASFAAARQSVVGKSTETVNPSQGGAQVKQGIDQLEPGQLFEQGQGLMESPVVRQEFSDGATSLPKLPPPTPPSSLPPPPPPPPPPKVASVSRGVQASGLLNEIRGFNKDSLKKVSENQVLNLGEISSGTTTKESTNSRKLGSEVGGVSLETAWSLPGPEGSIDIVGHSSEGGTKIEGKSPQQLAQLLKEQYGLQKIKTINLVSCESEQFKTAFKQALADLGVEVGNIEGAKGRVAVDRATGKLLDEAVVGDLNKIDGHDGALNIEGLRDDFNFVRINPHGLAVERRLALLDEIEQKLNNLVYVNESERSQLRRDIHDGRAALRTLDARQQIATGNPRSVQEGARTLIGLGQPDLIAEGARALIATRDVGLAIEGAYALMRTGHPASVIEGARELIRIGQPVLEEGAQALIATREIGLVQEGSRALINSGDLGLAINGAQTLMRTGHPASVVEGARVLTGIGEPSLVAEGARALIATRDIGLAVEGAHALMGTGQPVSVVEGARELIRIGQPVLEEGARALIATRNPELVLEGARALIATRDIGLAIEGAQTLIRTGHPASVVEGARLLIGIGEPGLAAEGARALIATRDPRLVQEGARALIITNDPALAVEGAQALQSLTNPAALQRRANELMESNGLQARFGNTVAVLSVYDIQNDRIITIAAQNGQRPGLRVGDGELSANVPLQDRGDFGLNHSERNIIATLTSMQRRREGGPFIILASAASTSICESGNREAPPLELGCRESMENFNRTTLGQDLAPLYGSPFMGKLSKKQQEKTDGQTSLDIWFKKGPKPPPPPPTGSSGSGDSASSAIHID